MLETLRSLAAGEDGQTMVEYALLLTLIGMACVATLTPLGTAVAGVFTTVTGSF